MADTAIKKCTSKRYKKDTKDIECGEPLLLIMSTDGEPSAYICEYCDMLEALPYKMRGRIFEQ